nr:transketolase C-terminal domain-containing protein [Kordiimonas gwangyangensis]
MMAAEKKRIRKLTIAKAMSEAIDQAMTSNPDVFVMGEDVGKLGGVFGTTTGLFDKYGPDRVRDTPISETGFIGAAAGAAVMGMRPVVELMFIDFFGVCMDVIYNFAAKNSYFSGGRQAVPMVLMTSAGGGYSDGGQHSQCLYTTFAHLPGLKVVMPSNAYDAKGMMTAAINDDNPVIFIFHKSLQGMGWLGTAKGAIVDVPETVYEVPLGKANISREGSDITVVGFGNTVHHALDAARDLALEGISAEVVDLRSLAPLDRETVLASVRKTGRLLAVDDDHLSYGWTGEVIASVAEAGIALKCPARRIAYRMYRYPSPVPWSNSCCPMRRR